MGTKFLIPLNKSIYSYYVLSKNRCCRRSDVKSFSLIFRENVLRYPESMNSSLRNRKFTAGLCSFDSDSFRTEDPSRWQWMNFSQRGWNLIVTVFGKFTLYIRQWNLTSRILWNFEIVRSRPISNAKFLNIWKTPIYFCIARLQFQLLYNWVGYFLFRSFHFSF